MKVFSGRTIELLAFSWKTGSCYPHDSTTFSSSKIKLIIWRSGRVRGNILGQH